MDLFVVAKIAEAMVDKNIWALAGPLGLIAGETIGAFVGIGSKGK